MGRGEIAFVATAGFFAAVSSLAVAACVGDAPAGLPDDNGGGDSAPIEGGSGQDGPSGSETGVDGGASGEWTLAATAKSQFNAMVIDEAGDLYLAGTVTGAAPELGITTTQDASPDALVMKVSGATGKVIWSKAFGGSGEEHVIGLALSGGQLFVTGGTTSASMTIGTTSLTFPASSISMATQSFFAQLAGDDGTVGWAASPDSQEKSNTAHMSVCTRVAVTTLPLFACAYMGTSFRGAPSSSRFAAALLSVTGSGTVIQTEQAFTSTTSGVIPSILTGSTGVVYMGGVTGGDFNDKLNTNYLVGGSGTNGFLVSLSPASLVVASMFFSPKVADSYGLPELLRVQGNNLFVAGKMSGSAFFGTQTGNAVGGEDAFLARVQTDLKAVSAVTVFGGTKDEDTTALVAKGTGDVLVGGTYGSSDLAFAGSTFPSGSQGGYQGFVAEVNADQPKAATTYTSTTGNVSVNGLEVDSSGYLFTSGTYNGQATFGAGVTATSTGDNAAFVFRRKL